MCSRLCCRELGWRLGQISEHILEELTCAPCYYYTFNTGTRAVLQDQGGLTIKTTTDSWLAWNLKQIPLALKCQINNETSQIFPNTKTESPLENWRLPTTRQFHSFALNKRLFRTILGQGCSLLSQNCNSCSGSFAVDDLGSTWDTRKGHQSAVEI